MNIENVDLVITIKDGVIVDILSDSVFNVVVVDYDEMELDGETAYTMDITNLSGLTSDEIEAIESL